MLRFNRPLSVIGVVLVGITSVAFMLVHQHVPEPYMDEIFHIPQAQAYCRNEFSRWDSKITTLPGLYIATWLLMKPIETVRSHLQSGSSSSSSQFSQSVFESVSMLRSVNVLFLVACCLLFHKIILHEFKKDKQHKQSTPQSESGAVSTPGIGNSSKTDAWICALKAFRLSLLPVHWFFALLFYTDLGSSFFVLLTYYLGALRKWHLLAATVGVISVVFRQTNIVWVFFTACVVMVQEFEIHTSSEFKTIKISLALVVRLFLKCLWPYAMVGLAFVTFVILNGGIVVGDRENHSVTLHLPQLFYFFSFFALLSPGETLSVVLSWFRPDERISRKSAVSSLLWNLLFLSAFGLFAFWAISNFTMAHKFLLSDNRHYTFYIWKNLFRKHEFVKFALIPFYFLCFHVLLSTLRKCKSIHWILIYFGCVLISVAVLPLLEFRYFLVPFLIASLCSSGRHTTIRTELFDSIVYLVINAFTVWMFVFKPFVQGEEVSRFMW